MRCNCRMTTDRDFCGCYQKGAKDTVYSLCLHHKIRTDTLKQKLDQKDARIKKLEEIIFTDRNCHAIKGRANNLLLNINCEKAREYQAKYKGEW